MSRSFSIPTVLRMVPNRLLKEFFERLGHDGLDVAWAELGEREIEPIVEALSQFNRSEYDRLEAALHNVYDLACESGINAILESGVQCGNEDLAAEMPQDVGPYHQSMWAWLHRSEIVERALLVHQVENLAWWRKRTDLPRVAPSNSTDAYRELEKELSELLLRAQGRGKVCTVEPLHLRGTDYFFAHPDDFVQNVTAHDDDGRLAPRAYRRTFAIVFAFNAEEGALELFARVPAKLKPRIEEVFARTMLGVELEDWNPDSYDLDRLKRRSFALTTDPEDCVRARVRRLRLSFKNSHRRLLLEADPDGPASDIYDMIDEVLNEERVPLSSVHVTLATFGFEFLPLDGRKPGSMSFDVAFPNTCSLRNQRPERIELALKYLKRWKIDVSRTPVPNLAAAGQ